MTVKRSASQAANGQKGICCRTLLSITETASFMAMVTHFTRTALHACGQLPFDLRFLAYLFAGCLVPLIIVGSIAAVNALFWSDQPLFY